MSCRSVTFSNICYDNEPITCSQTLLPTSGTFCAGGTFTTSLPFYNCDILLTRTATQTLNCNFQPLSHTCQSTSTQNYAKATLTRVAMVTNTNGCFFPITDVHTYHEVVTFKSGSVNGVVATSRTTTSHTTTHRTTTSPHTSSHSPSPSPHSPSPVSPLVSIKVVNSPVVTVVNSPVISISYIHSPESSQISSPLAKDENSSIGTLNVKENSTGNMTMIIGIAAAVLVLVIAIMAVIVIRQLRSKRPTSIIYTDNQLHEQRQPLFVNYSDMQYMSAPPQSNSQQHGVIMGTPQANPQQNFILGSTVNQQNVAAVEIPNAGFLVNAQSNQQTLYQENAYIPSPNQNAGMLTPIASQTRI